MRSTQYEGKQAWSWKPGQLLKATEVVDLEGDPSTTILLN